MKKAKLLCQKCKGEVKRFFVIRRFGVPLCGSCNKKFRKQLNIFDKIRAAFSIIAQEKSGEVFGKWLEGKYPTDFKINFHIYYEERKEH